MSTASTRHLIWIALLTLALTACDESPDPPAPIPTPDVVPEDTGEADEDIEDPMPDAPEPDPEPEGIEGISLMSRIGGLWSGAATQTPLGEFPVMFMDLRPANDRLLFARADLNADNNLRFAFTVETHGDRDVLIYRNGGFFQGLLRDSRAALIEHDPEANTWRFCEVSRGCDLIDATWRLEGEDSLTLDVKVRGEQHVLWTARRQEARPLPDPFPIDETSTGDNDSPYPEMPSLKVEVTWRDPLPQDGTTWIILSTTDCGITGTNCNPSRAIGVAAPALTTSAELVLEQLHPGEYALNALLDRNNNFFTTRFPDRGDGVALPDTAITVDDEGQTEARVRIFVDR